MAFHRACRNGEIDKINHFITLNAKVNRQFNPYEDDEEEKEKSEGDRRWTALDSAAMDAVRQNDYRLNHDAIAHLLSNCRAKASICNSKHESFLKEKCQDLNVRFEGNIVDEIEEHEAVDPRYNDGFTSNITGSYPVDTALSTVLYGGAVVIGSLDQLAGKIFGKKQQ